MSYQHCRFPKKNTFNTINNYISTVNNSINYFNRSNEIISNMYTNLDYY